jgi:hypothetical protein
MVAGKEDRNNSRCVMNDGLVEKKTCPKAEVITGI